MAEYVDRMSILDTTICEGIACEHCSFGVKDDTCLLRSRVLALPTADVVERSKIDKAIEEIQALLIGNDLGIKKICITSRKH